MRDAAPPGGRWRYPPAHRQDLVEQYHGVSVADPYRWLEDPASPETRAWMAAQNALTRAVLDGPVRARLRARLTTLFDYPRVSPPVARGERLFFLSNPGLQPQPVLCVREPDAGTRTLIDPHAFSADGTTALTGFLPDEAGRLLAYARSTHGSDRQEIFVREVATGRDLPDRIRWVKFATLAWLPDASGFYYTRFPEPGTVPPGDEQYFSRVMFHVMGRPQSEDVLVYERPEDREIVLAVETAGDGRFFVITAHKGASPRAEILLLEHGGSVQPIFTGFDAAYQYVASAGGRLYFRTDLHAPRGRIVAVDADGPRPAFAPGASARQARLVEIVPETSDTLSAAVIVRDRLIASFLKNACDEIRLFELDGAPAGAIPLPAAGTLTGLSGRPEDRAAFIGFTSFLHPPAVYRYEVAAGELTAFHAPPAPLDVSAFETRQVWYPSRDGTPISMFLVHRRDLSVDGNRPVLLSGYGGFNVSRTPVFDPLHAAWVEQGGLFALANLRGGGEYGEAWHRAGMRERKQTVFDDFMAAAGWLMREGYTRATRLAIEGGSNGGLLVGAVLAQRPDLIGAVVCRVPVADMLRYHLFTVGRFWIPEYGCADDPEQFRVLWAYSPYHRVVDGTRYPATLVTTADTDDRVDPGMARKFAARLQAATAGDAPVLIRIEERAGHGVGKPVWKLIDEDADILAFLSQVLEVS